MQGMSYRDVLIFLVGCVMPVIVLLFIFWQAACVYVLLNAARLVDRVDHFDENRTDDGPRARLPNRDE